MMKYGKKTTLVIVMLIAFLTQPAAAQDEQTPEQQIAALTAKVRSLKSTVERLRVENSKLREELMQHREDDPSEESSEEEVAEQADAPEPQQPTYRGQPVTKSKLDTLWRRHGKQYIMHDDVVFDIGAALASKKLSHKISYGIRSGDHSMQLNMPHRVKVKRLVKGGAICLLRETNSPDRTDREVLILGKFRRGQRITNPLLTILGGMVPNPTRSGETYEVIKPVTRERFIEALNDGMIVYRHFAKKRRGPTRLHVAEVTVRSEEVK